MASTIKLKNSTTAGNTPSSLETGEVAINVADGNLFYGSASAVLQNFVVDELEVKGNLTAQQYIVSSSVTYTTQSFSSGSTAFGDSADDTHVFTGNITASGNISASSDIIVPNLEVGNKITHIGDSDTYLQFADDDDFRVIAGGIDAIKATNSKIIFNSGQANYDFQIASDHNSQLFYADANLQRIGIGTDAPGDKLEVIGNISASENIYGKRFYIQPSLLAISTPNTNSINFGFSSFATTLNYGKLTSTSHKFTGTITGSSHISASGDITATNLHVTEYIKHVGDSGTEIHFSADDRIDLNTGGNVRVRIVNDGVTVTNGRLKTNSHITASGNISASGDIKGSEFYVNGKALANTSGDTIRFGWSQNMPIEIGKDSNPIKLVGQITASIISASDNIYTNELHADTVEAQYNYIDTGSSVLDSAGGSIGDIVKFGGTSTTAGHLYVLSSDGSWANTNASGSTVATGSLAVALGSNSTTDGMLLKGMTNLSTDPGAGIGSPVFLSTQTNQAQSVAPSASGDFVRIVGHQFGTDLIYFNPSPDFIEVS